MSDGALEPPISAFDAASMRRRSFPQAANGDRSHGVRHRPRVGVVLAAGRAARLRRVTKGRSKVLTRLGGVPLVERAVRTLLDGGLERVVVVVGYQAAAVAEAVRRIEPGAVEVVRAEDWEKGNGASLAAAEDAVAGEDLFVVLCADHVFGDRSLHGLLHSTAPAVLVDESPEQAAWAEGTRVRVHVGQALAFGKELPDPGIDCGAFVLGPEVFDRQREASRDGDFSLAGAVSRLALTEPLRAEPLPEGAWWQDIDTPEDLRAARGALRRSLAKGSDGAVSRYLNRPISTRVTMLLAPLRLSPNLLSIVTGVIGLVGGCLFAARHGVAGALMVHASSVLDGIDGETARLHSRSGPRGAMLDNLLDRMVDAGVIVGLGLWAIRAPVTPKAFLILFAIAVGWGLAASAGRESTISLTLPTTVEGLLGYSMGSRDGRMFLMTIGGLIGRPLLGLLTMSIVYSLTVGLRLILVRRLALQGAIGEPGPRQL